MIKHNGIGVLPGLRISYIDHLLPLCHILGFSLLCTDRIIKEIIEIHYPESQVILADSIDYCLNNELKSFTACLTVDHARKAHGSFQFSEYVCTRRMRSIYAPHGNSDKNLRNYWIEKLNDEDIVLVYGPQMVDFMRSKGIEKPVILTGNYRLEYYLAFQEHFDAMTKFHLFPNSGRKTILYAPTWTSAHKASEKRFDYSSFFEACHFVLGNIPDEFQVIVKIHPHLVFLHGDLIEEIKDRYQNNPQISFLENFPLIYPLLKHCDLYLGDYSSIGYDYLYYDRPLFFLNSNEVNYPLQQCGISLTPQNFSKIYSIISQNLQNDFIYRERRKKQYAYAFGETKPLSLLRQEIEYRLT